LRRRHDQPHLPHSNDSARDAAIVDREHKPADGTVIVFPADKRKWIDGWRFIKAARPDQTGVAPVKAPPPGEYLAVAVDYVEDGGWYDPEYLESMQRFARTVTAATGAASPVTLTVVLPQ
jgi:hypothetical protein